jgi:hypothetical protein
MAPSVETFLTISIVDRLLGIASVHADFRDLTVEYRRERTSEFLKIQCLI